MEVLFAYAHLFLFPVFFGPFVVFLLVPVASYVLCTPEIRRHRKAVAVLIVLLTLLVTVADGFFGNHAIWEISDAVTTESMSSHFKEPSPDTAEGYADSINSHIHIVGDWSLVRYLYLVSLFVQTFVMLTFFLVLSVLALHDPENSAEAVRKQSLTIRMGLGYVFCLTWLILRLAFVFTEKARLYPSAETLTIGNAVILGLFGLAFLYLVVMLWIKYHKIPEAISTILSVSGLTTVAVVKLFGFRRFVLPSGCTRTGVSFRAWSLGVGFGCSLFSFERQEVMTLRVPHDSRRLDSLDMAKTELNRRGNCNCSDGMKAIAETHAGFAVIQHDTAGKPVGGALAGLRSLRKSGCVTVDAALTSTPATDRESVSMTMSTSAPSLVAEVVEDRQRVVPTANCQLACLRCSWYANVSGSCPSKARSDLSAPVSTPSSTVARRVSTTWSFGDLTRRLNRLLC